MQCEYGVGFHVLVVNPAVKGASHWSLSDQELPGGKEAPPAENVDQVVYQAFLAKSCCVRSYFS
jgi:hypothetical protein